MLKIKVFISISIFSLLLILTSFIKNETREIEKNIYEKSKTVNSIEKDLFESELDFSYLTSPSIIEQKIEYLDNKEYYPMEFSKIFLDISIFKNLQNKFVIKKNIDEKKIKKE
mgnify:CR=1 FL=1|tara:strand:+ start:259 stop:597 length:339 start_codon:yes stop_codon:yes gene_type:complete